MVNLDTISMYYELIFTILLYGWPFLLLCGLFIMKLRYKSWPVEAVIIEKRGDNLIKTNDRAGKYTDGFAGVQGYRLQKAKDTIPIINYDWVLHNAFKPTTLGEKFTALLRGNIGTIFLFRYGSKQYKPINIKLKDGTKQQLKEILDVDGNPAVVRIYEQFDPRKHLGALNFDVIDWDNMNFMVQEMRASVTRRQKKGQFLKEVLLPMGIIIICALVCIMMIKFSYDFAINMKGSAPAPAPATNPNVPIIGEMMPGT